MSEGDVIEGGSHARGTALGLMSLLVVLALAALWTGGHSRDQRGQALAGLHLSWQSAGPGGNELLLTFEMRNEGVQAVEVLGVGGDQPGLRFINARAFGDLTDPDGQGSAGLPHPSDLDPGEAKQFVLSYRVLKCSAPTATVLRLTVRARIRGRESQRVLVDEFGPVLSRIFESKDSWTEPCASST